MFVRFFVNANFGQLTGLNFGHKILCPIFWRKKVIGQKKDLGHTGIIQVSFLTYLKVG
jgi:hypothetical protein